MKPFIWKLVLFAQKFGFVYIYVNKTNFHIKGFTLGLALKQRQKPTQKSPIKVKVIFAVVRCTDKDIGKEKHMRALWLLNLTCLLKLIHFTRIIHTSKSYATQTFDQYHTTLTCVSELPRI